MKIHSRLFLFIAILALSFPALNLACGGEEPTGSTPAVESRTTEAPGISDGGGGDTGGATPPEAPGASGEISAANILDALGGMDSGRAEGEFASVSAGGAHTCGVRLDGSVACWGADSLGRTAPREGEFTSVSAGNQHTCGVRVDGSVACWGSDRKLQATPPEGDFASVSAGDNNTCGVRVDGSVACWGSDISGKSTAPESTPAG